MPTKLFKLLWLPSLLLASACATTRTLTPMTQCWASKGASGGWIFTCLDHAGNKYFPDDKEIQSLISFQPTELKLHETELRK